MKEVNFVTGNQKKADYFSELIGCEIEHVKVDVDEIQSLNLREVVEHKLEQAYNQIKKPVLVDDVSLEFKALGRLPGTYIKSFQDELTHEQICRLIDGQDRSAVAKCILGYYDGKTKTYFEGSLKGKVPDSPAGTDGFGWDPIFIPEGHEVTRAELSKEDDLKTYKLLKRIDDLKVFLLN
jgi:non-canonical purine NTP pyrophosphatase (RdgB/HAM1 family)